MNEANMVDGIDPADVWMQTTSGRRVHLLNPTPDEIDLGDICTALSRLVRFTGHGIAPWTIAEHSCVVGEIVRRSTSDPIMMRTALLHDATEAYIGDLSRPLKHALRVLGGNPSPLDVIEAALWGAICERFDCHYVLPDLVKVADNQALGLEADELFGPGTRQAWGLPVHDPIDRHDTLLGKLAVWAAS